MRTEVEGLPAVGSKLKFATEPPGARSRRDAQELAALLMADARTDGDD